MSKSSASQPPISTATKSTSEHRSPHSLELHPTNERIYGGVDITGDFIKSIYSEGILYPIIVTDEDRIIDGHRRILAAKYLGLDEVPVHIESFSSSLLERRAVLHYNKQRRKTFTQMVREGLELEEVESELAKKRQGTRTDLGDSLHQGKSGRTDEIVAEAIGIGSRTTYQVAKKIHGKKKEGHEKAVEEVRKLDSENQTIHGAWREIEEYDKRKENEEQVKWEELEQVAPKVMSYTEKVTEFFLNEGSAVKNRGTWFERIESLSTRMSKDDSFKDAHRYCVDAWGEDGLRYTFLYLLEKHGFVSVSGDITDPDSAELESIQGRKPRSSILRELHYEDGLTLREIEMRFGVQRQLVVYWFWEDNIPVKKGILTGDGKRKLSKLRKDGL